MYSLSIISREKHFRTLQRACVTETFFFHVLSVYTSFPKKHPVMMCPFGKSARFIGSRRYLKRIKRISHWSKRSSLIGFVLSFHVIKDYYKVEK